MLQYNNISFYLVLLSGFMPANFLSSASAIQLFFGDEGSCFVFEITGFNLDPAFMLSKKSDLLGSAVGLGITVAGLTLLVINGGGGGADNS